MWSRRMTSCDDIVRKRTWRHRGPTDVQVTRTTDGPSRPRISQRLLRGVQQSLVLCNGDE